MEYLKCGVKEVYRLRGEDKIIGFVLFSEVVISWVG